MPDKTKVHTVYRLTSGDRVPSVTTVLGILNKPALLEWAWQCGCKGLDYKAIRDQAADIGTLVHYLIMRELKGEKPDTSGYSAQDIEKAENCLLKFYEWQKTNKLVPLFVETPLISEEYKFGGTIDCFGAVNGEVMLLDFKTGKAIYPEMFYQLAAYAHLLHENGHLVKTAKILRIGREESEDFEERTMTTLDKQWEIFLHCLAVYNLQKETRKDKSEN